MLRELDLAAAQVELGRALEIAPYNSGNRLKQAQLYILLGRPADALGILEDLEKVALKRADRERLSELRRCLDNKAGVKCVGK